MHRNTEGALIFALGPMAAILLGMVLFPFREATSASNYTFLFLILTIFSAEYGGQGSAVATALTSAMSLDFFLTQPYEELAIKSIHDVVAFAGLALCGLLVATFSSQRGMKSHDLELALRQLDLLHLSVETLADPSQAELHLHKVLDSVSICAPVTAAAVRDPSNSVLAAWANGPMPDRIPPQILSPYTLLPKGADVGSHDSAPFPTDGVRIPLMSGNQQVGWLDLWGNGERTKTGIRRTLSDVGFMVAQMIAGRVKNSSYQSV